MARKKGDKDTHTNNNINKNCNKTITKDVKKIESDDIVNQKNQEFYTHTKIYKYKEMRKKRDERGIKEVKKKEEEISPLAMYALMLKIIQYTGNRMAVTIEQLSFRPPIQVYPIPFFFSRLIRINQRNLRDTHKIITIITIESGKKTTESYQTLHIKFDLTTKSRLKSS